VLNKLDGFAVLIV